MVSGCHGISCFVILSLKKFKENWTLQTKGIEAIPKLQNDESDRLRENGWNLWKMLSRLALMVGFMYIYRFHDILVRYFWNHLLQFNWINLKTKEGSNHEYTLGKWQISHWLNRWWCAVVVSMRAHTHNCWLYAVCMQYLLRLWLMSGDYFAGNVKWYTFTGQIVVIVHDTTYKSKWSTRERKSTSGEQESERARARKKWQPNIIIGCWSYVYLPNRLIFNSELRSNYLLTKGTL